MGAPCCGTGWAHQTAPLGLCLFAFGLVVKDSASNSVVDISSAPEHWKPADSPSALCSSQLILILHPSVECHAEDVVQGTAMSDEVSDFLRSVERLKERREEEDEARSRELEEKILQEKKERQARRAGTLNPILCLFTPPQSTHHITLHPVESGRVPSWTAHFESLNIARGAACWNCPAHAPYPLLGWKC